MKASFSLILLVFLVSCGFYVNYTKVESARGNKKPFSLFQSKKVFLLKLNLPHSYTENRLSLPLILRQAFLSKLVQNGALILYGKNPQSYSESTKVFQKEPFNWFFKSSGFHENQLQENIDINEADYFININIVDWQAGVTLNSSWLQYNIEIFDSKKQLVDLIQGEGFYHSLFKLQN